MSGLHGYVSPFTPQIIQSPSVTSCQPSRVSIAQPVLLFFQNLHHLFGYTSSILLNLKPGSDMFSIGINCSASIVIGLFVYLIQHSLPASACLNIYVPCLLFCISYYLFNSSLCINEFFRTVIPVVY